MTKRGTEVTVSSLPDCDIHKYTKQDEPSVPAHYDGKTVDGPWAYMCDPCFETHGIGLGTGKGQRLVLEKVAPE